MSRRSRPAKTVRRVHARPPTRTPSARRWFCLRLLATVIACVVLGAAGSAPALSFRREMTEWRPTGADGAAVGVVTAWVDGRVEVRLDEPLKGRMPPRLRAELGLHPATLRPGDRVVVVWTRPAHVEVLSARLDGEVVPDAQLIRTIRRTWEGRESSPATRARLALEGLRARSDYEKYVAARDLCSRWGERQPLGPPDGSRTWDAIFREVVRLARCETGELPVEAVRALRCGPPARSLPALRALLRCPEDGPRFAALRVAESQTGCPVGVLSGDADLPAAFDRIDRCLEEAIRARAKR